MRISDWSSDVCSSDLGGGLVEGAVVLVGGDPGIGKSTLLLQAVSKMAATLPGLYVTGEESLAQVAGRAARLGLSVDGVHALAETGIERILEHAAATRSEEHTSELPSLMRISYAVFCLQKNSHKSCTTKLLNN